MSRIGGVVYLRIDGKLITLAEGDLTFNVGGMKKEAVLSSSGVAGFSAKARVPFIEGEFIHNKDLDIKQVEEAEDVNVTAELYNGRTFVLHNACYVGEGDITGEGKYKFRFEGKKGELIDG